MANNDNHGVNGFKATPMRSEQHKHIWCALIWYLKDDLITSNKQLFATDAKVARWRNWPQATGYIYYGKVSRAYTYPRIYTPHRHNTQDKLRYTKQHHNNIHNNTDKYKNNNNNNNNNNNTGKTRQQSKRKRPRCQLLLPRILLQLKPWPFDHYNSYRYAYHAFVTPAAYSLLRVFWCVGQKTVYILQTV